MLFIGLVSLSVPDQMTNDFWLQLSNWHVYSRYMSLLFCCRASLRFHILFQGAVGSQESPRFQSGFTGETQLILFLTDE